MANNKQRYINTRFWNDGYVADLDPIEKLLFIYFLTNEHTNIAGVYEVPLKIIAIETGLDTTMLVKILPRLSDKVNYVDGFVVIKNFIKHQETESPNVRKGITNCLQELKNDFLEFLTNKGYLTLTKEISDTLCIPYIEGRNYSNSNLYSNLDLNSKHKVPKKENKTFESFWSSYPNKTNKKKTEEIWGNKKLDSKLKEILNFIEKAKETDRWSKGFIKAPDVFLRNETWNDDLSAYGKIKSESDIIKI